MTVRDLLKMEICVDVVDDVTEELYIAFDGPQALTREGEKEFALALDLEAEPSRDPNLWIIHVDSDDERTWKRRLRSAIKLFNGMAGYCSESDYDLWFREESDEAISRQQTTKPSLLSWSPIRFCGNGSRPTGACSTSTASSITPYEKGCVSYEYPACTGEV